MWSDKDNKLINVNTDDYLQIIVAVGYILMKNTYMKCSDNFKYLPDKSENKTSPPPVIFETKLVLK